MWAVVQDKDNRLRHRPGFYLGCPGAGTNRSAPRAAHTREIGMRQHFALAVMAIKEEDDVADLSLRLVPLEPETYTLDLTCNPTAFHVCRSRRQRNLFCSSLDNCDQPTLPPRAS